MPITSTYVLKVTRYSIILVTEKCDCKCSSSSTVYTFFMQLSWLINMNIILCWAKKLYQALLQEDTACKIGLGYQYLFSDWQEIQFEPCRKMASKFGLGWLQYASEVLAYFIE